MKNNWRSIRKARQDPNDWRNHIWAWVGWAAVGLAMGWALARGL